MKAIVFVSLLIMALFNVKNAYAVESIPATFEEVVIPTINCNAYFGWTRYASGDTAEECYTKIGVIVNDPFVSINKTTTIQHEVRFQNFGLLWTSWSASSRTENQYSCLDSAFPDLQGELCFEVFVIDQDLIIEYMALTSRLEDDWALSSESDIPNTLEKLLAEQEQIIAMNSLAQSVADTNLMSQQGDAVASLVASNPELTSLIDYNAKIEIENVQANALVDDSFVYAQTMSDAINAGESAFDSNSVLYNQQNSDYEAVLELNNSLSSATTQAEFTAITDQIIALDANIIDREPAINDNNIDINYEYEKVTTNSNNITDNSSQVTENLIQTTNNYNSANSAVGNGETCVGTMCVATPEPTPEEPEEKEYSSISHSTNDYASFNDVNTAFYNSLENSPLISSFNMVPTFVTVGVGTCPPLSFDLTGTIFNKVISTDIFCTLLEPHKEIISMIFMIIYTVMGFRIFASA